jgi:hypothetical protein
MSKQHSGNYYVKEAEKNGLRVEMGKGDHCKIYGNVDRGYMVVPLHRELATGTECAIRKWLLRMGVVLAGVLFFALRTYLLGL